MTEVTPEWPFTALQGQYLAFIRAYTLIHRRAPAERDLQAFFRVTPPAVHDMILTLESRGFIERTPGMARSIRIQVPANEIPTLLDPAERNDGERRRTRG